MGFDETRECACLPASDTLPAINNRLGTLIAVLLGRVKAPRCQSKIRPDDSTLPYRPRMRSMESIHVSDMTTEQLRSLVDEAAEGEPELHTIKYPTREAWTPPR